MLLPHLLVSLLPTLISAATLTLSVPPHIPALPPSTSAILTTHGQRIKVPVTRSNTFVFRNLTSPSTSDPASSGSERGISVSYLLDIACRDYDFLFYGVDVKSGGVVQVYRVSRGGIVTGEKVTVGEEPVEVRVLRGRDYYEARAGCMCAPILIKLRKGEKERESKGMEMVELGDVTERRNPANARDTVSPLDLLKNPMILIAVVGLGFVVGMPYLMDSSMSTSLRPSPDDHDS